MYDGLGIEQVSDTRTDSRSLSADSCCSRSVRTAKTVDTEQLARSTRHGEKRQFPVDLSRPGPGNRRRRALSAAPCQLMQLISGGYWGPHQRRRFTASPASEAIGNPTGCSQLPRWSLRAVMCNGFFRLFPCRVWPAWHWRFISCRGE